MLNDLPCARIGSPFAVAAVLFRVAVAAATVVMVALVLFGQMGSTVTIDHFGLFGALLRAMTWQRAGGLVLIRRGQGAGLTWGQRRG